MTTTTNPPTRRVSELVQAARAGIEDLTPDQVASEVAKGALLLDLREPEERKRAGAIPGALHVPRGMLEFHADASTPYHIPALAPHKRTILYCASGGRSALGAKALRELGYVDVAHLGGGFKACSAAGKPVSQVLE